MNRLNTMKYSFDCMQGLDLFSTPTSPDRLGTHARTHACARAHTHLVYAGGSFQGYKAGGEVSSRQLTPACFRGVQYVESYPVTHVIRLHGGGTEMWVCVTVCFVLYWRFRRWGTANLLVAWYQICTNGWLQVRSAGHLRGSSAELDICCWTFVSLCVLLRATRITPASFRKAASEIWMYVFHFQSNLYDNTTLCFAVSDFLKVTVVLGVRHGTDSNGKNISISQKNMALWTTALSLRSGCESAFQPGMRNSVTTPLEQGLCCCVCNNSNLRF
jgi:hypothetical protein